MSKSITRPTSARIRSNRAPNRPTSSACRFFISSIEDEILQQRAAKLNLAASDEDVTAKLTEMKAPYTQEELDKQLKQRNMTLDDLEARSRRTLTKEKLLNKEIESKINITDSDISTYYNAHKAEFNLIEPQYHLYQIVASAVPAQQAGNNLPAKPINEADAKNKIQVLYNRLRSGEDFASVAIQFSDNAEQRLQSAATWVL